MTNDTVASYGDLSQLLGVGVLGIMAASFRAACLA